MNKSLPARKGPPTRARPAQLVERRPTHETTRRTATAITRISPESALTSTGTDERRLRPKKRGVRGIYLSVSLNRFESRTRADSRHRHWQASGPHAGQAARLRRTRQSPIVAVCDTRSTVVVFATVRSPFDALLASQSCVDTTAESRAALRRKAPSRGGAPVASGPAALWLRTDVRSCT